MLMLENSVIERSATAEREEIWAAKFVIESRSYTLTNFFGITLSVGN